VPIPENSLDAATTRNSQPCKFDNPKNFETVIYTPFFEAALQNEYASGANAEKERRVKKRDKNGIKDELQSVPGHFWERYAMKLSDAVVEIQVRPSLREKSSSIWGGVLDAMAGVPIRQAKMEFRDDFWDMALFRGTTLVQPVFRQRENVRAIYADENVAVNDNAYAGVYFYDPSAFEPSENLTLYVRRESDLNRWDSVRIDKKDQEAIWNQFADYRAALDGPTRTTIVGLSKYCNTPPRPGAETAGYQWMSAALSEDVTPGTSPGGTTSVLSDNSRGRSKQ
jgi:hypothetical protein